MKRMGTKSHYIALDAFLFSFFQSAPMTTPLEAQQQAGKSTSSGACGTAAQNSRGELEACALHMLEEQRLQEAVGCAVAPP